VTTNDLNINVEEEVKKLKEIIYDEQNETFIMELQRLSEPVHIYKDYAEKIAVCNVI